jgi:histidyl-tRNA synthetase
MESGNISVKNMVTGEQSEVAKEKLLELMTKS